MKAVPRDDSVLYHSPENLFFEKKTSLAGGDVYHQVSHRPCLRITTLLAGGEKPLIIGSNEERFCPVIAKRVEISSFIFRMVYVESLVRL